MNDESHQFLMVHLKKYVMLCIIKKIHQICTLAAVHQTTVTKRLFAIYEEKYQVIFLHSAAGNIL